MAHPKGSTGPGIRPRPLSPHLSIWKWSPAMAVSILHRVSGNGMAVAGLGVLLWFVGAIASGPAAYATFAGVMGSPIGIIVLIGISWAFFNHLMSGIRHLVLDVGAGFEVDRNNRWATISILLGIVLTVLFWAIILFAK
ncbi:succinate dehydrogenase, cytochrome b556 subunit [Croceicoccus marinus]|jgi:succinate dehydrogenase / fumarate reductase cytochrome b subunit|uniref:Succinate dehydrogenase cytochrome b556 subunit n=2 Tax=Croceicoccus marinus TaxID=450378 RepID=A0A1Z1FDN4_9SPHN|nr:succinate dehydrogenase, cytochrome b556 subunit [Croceicoccus marinus]ARU16874.1 succinate dehydrogenase, cytochrome b556 subunit [Croceicoccus marinus]QNE05720.1 succinate dehydrogenase, cytochrome b556 subunit [Croceicoccus marinus]